MYDESKTKLVNNNKRLSLLVKDQLMDLIMEGKLRVGEKISEDELAELLGVSRMPVREALRIMESGGLITSTPFVGNQIRKLSRDEIIEIYFLRDLLETAALELAAQNITETEILMLEEIQMKINLYAHTQASVDRSKQLYYLNRDFHFTMYAAARSPKLLSFIENLWENIAFYRMKTVTTDEYSSVAQNEHEMYISLLKEGDAVKLKEKFSENIHKHKVRILETYDDSINAIE